MMATPQDRTAITNDLHDMIRHNLEQCSDNILLEFNKSAKTLMPANITLLSSCRRTDDQANANYTSNTTSALPDPQGSAGGACTSALLKVLYNEENRVALGELSYYDVLTSMRQTLGNLSKQIPQLSGSRPIQMSRPFQFIPNSTRKRALLIGINYPGQQGELSGCHNDVMNMKEYIIDTHGFTESDIKVLMDHGNDQNEEPTFANIMRECRRLVAESRAGDSVLFHFSGHGGRLRGDINDEKEKYDETLIPSDYNVAGHIRDNDLFVNLICPMAAGVNLACLIDCCRANGPVLDLPFHFHADGRMSAMQQNQGMNFQRLNRSCSAIPVDRRRNNSGMNTIAQHSTSKEFKDRIPPVQKAAEYALLSKVIYKIKDPNSPEFRKGILSKLKLKCNFFYEDNSGVAVMIVTSNISKCVTVVFRGSDEWRDWNANRKILFSPFGPKESFLKFPWVIDSLVKVHRGFNNMVFGGDRFRKIADALEMARRENPGYQVAFTGHSLGAACSILAGAYTAWSMPDCQISVATFGAPRVANTSFKTWVEDLENVSLWRFVNDDDIIPRLPPAFVGYRHVGHLFHLEKSQARAYYRFRGDDDLGLVGAPEWKWNGK